jgi:hypothetical protein
VMRAAAARRQLSANGQLAPPSGDRRVDGTGRRPRRRQHANARGRQRLTSTPGRYPTCLRLARAVAHCGRQVQIVRGRSSWCRGHVQPAQERGDLELCADQVRRSARQAASATPARGRCDDHTLLLAAAQRERARFGRRRRSPSALRRNL